MSASALGLLLLGAGLGLHLQESGELPLNRSVALLEKIAEIIRGETGVRPIIDDPDWNECDLQESACQALVRSRTRTDELVLLRVFAGLTKLRVELRRLSQDGQGESVSGDLPLEEEGWETPLLPLVRTLFPDPLDPVLLRAREPNVVVGEATPSKAGTGAGPGPWIIIGARALAGGFGVGFYASSRDAKSELASGRLFSSEEFDELNGRLETHSILSGVLLGTAVTGLVTAIAWLIWD